MTEQFEALNSGVLTLHRVQILSADTQANVYSDPLESFLFTLAEGETRQATGTTNAIVELNLVSTQTYVGRETVSVPAGTFETCHFQVNLSFDEFDTLDDILTDTWVAVGSGVAVQIRNNVALDNQVLTSASINGMPVVP